jgi:hypothetical protein
MCVLSALMILFVCGSIVRAHGDKQMLSSGTAQTESIIANARHLKKTVVINGTSKIVPGYETAMCIMVGFLVFTAIKFLVLAPE